MAVKKRHWIWILVPLLLVAIVLAVAAPTVKRTAEKALYPATYRETVEAEALQHGISPSL